MTEVSVTRKGQITIPGELRRKFGIQEDCKVEVVEEHGRMVIRKLHSIFDLAGNGAGKGDVKQLKRISLLQNYCGNRTPFVLVIVIDLSLVSSGLELLV